MFSPVTASERGADGFVAEAAGDQLEKIFLDWEILKVKRWAKAGADGL